MSSNPILTGEQPIDPILTCEQPINRFSKIHLINQYGTKQYLDSYGGSDCNGGQWGVKTSKYSNRDTGSGTWEIRSASEPNIAGSIKYGDKIQLINQYGTKSYLDTCGHSSCSGGRYSVQTSTSPNRDHGSGTWEIKSASGINIGGLIKNGDKIHLINQYFIGKSYLDTCGNSNGNYGVQTSTSPNRDTGSGTWEIVLEGCIDYRLQKYEKGKNLENKL